MERGLEREFRFGGVRGEGSGPTQAEQSDLAEKPEILFEVFRAEESITSRESERWGEADGFSARSGSGAPGGR